MPKTAAVVLAVIIGGLAVGGVAYGGSNGSNGNAYGVGGTTPNGNAYGWEKNHAAPGPVAGVGLPVALAAMGYAWLRLRRR